MSSRCHRLETRVGSHPVLPYVCPSNGCLANLLLTKEIRAARCGNLLKSFGE